MPYLRTLVLALLFGSFLHPLKRFLSVFFRRICKEMREDPIPPLAGVMMPFSVIDKLVERLRLNFCHYGHEIIEFCRTILNRDWRSALAVCLAAMSLVVIGGNALMNYVMGINLIMFVTDVTKTSANFSDASLHFLVRSFCLAQICWLDTQIICLLVLLVLVWIGASRLGSLLKRRFYSSLGLVDTQDAQETNYRHDTYARLIYGKLSDLFELLLDQMESYIDTISSVCVIGFVGVIVILTTLYLSLQIYSESMYIVERISIAAQTPDQNDSEFKSWLHTWLDILRSLIDGAVKNAYDHGRVWIRTSTRQLLTNATNDSNQFNTTQSDLIEEQMVEFWERAYAMWLKNRPGESSANATLKAHHHPYDWNRLTDAFQSLDFALCTQIFKQNWDTLVSVMDSVLIVLKGNLNLFFGVATATLSLLIGGGNVILNFIIDLIIFTTALFYLLCASGDQYKPIELIKNLMPNTEPTMVMKAKGLGNRSEFINSVDESISAVFTASIKMMAFHGLSTWLLHRLFEIEVVYIPAVISALFGAVPFVSPYWVSLPACFDLYMSGQVTQSILMLILGIVPSSFVTTAFYSEIKGAGHPYLTGLAIAGGVFAFGIEGALFGPMILVTIRLLSLIVIYLADSKMAL